MNKILTILGFVVIAALLAFFLLRGEQISVDNLLTNLSPEGQEQQVIIETNRGNISIELYGKKSPISVNNFVDYIKTGFYNDTIFHRTIAGVIIQGGGFRSGMVAKDTRQPIENESKNGLLNLKGSISMARKSSANSATSQFFINLRNNPKLDYSSEKQGYAVFGKVLKGLEILEDVSRAETKTHGAHQNVPLEEFKLISVKLVVLPKLKELTQEAVDNDQSQKESADGFQEGIHFVRLQEPLSLLNTKKVEVIAAFSFGCGHCYGIYPSIEKWKSEKNKTVEFSYFHAVWNKAMRLYAKTYYTAIELKIEKKIHSPLFEAIVINQQTLSNLDELAEFFASFGVDKTRFVEVFNSEKITKRVEQAEKLTKRFHLASVPEFIVAGKFRVDPMRAGGPDKIFEVIDFLIEQEMKLNGS